MSKFVLNSLTVRYINLDYTSALHVMIQIEVFWTHLEFLKSKIVS